MEAGLMRKRLTIQAPTRSRDAVGADVETWHTLCQVWGWVREGAGREFAIGGQVIQAVGFVNIEIRWRNDVRPRCRVLMGSRIFDVNDAMDPDGFRRKLQLSCKEAQ